MSIGKNFWHWCRIPREPPKKGHKKLLASSLICNILGATILVSLALFYGGFMAGQGGNFAVLSVANLGEGPSFIENATYQPVAEANSSTVQNYEQTMQLIQDNESNSLSFGGGLSYSANDSGNVNTTVINFGEKNLIVTSIEIYQGDHLFALIDGPFIVKAHTVGTLDFQVYNLTELSKREAQQLTPISGNPGDSNETTCNWPYEVLYTAVLKTSEGDVLTFDHFTFPTAPDSRFS